MAISSPIRISRPSLTGTAGVPGLRAATSEPVPAWAAVTLVVIALLGIALRLYCAQAFPYDQDELYTRIDATQLFHTPIQPGIDARPVFFLLEHVVLRLLPDTPFVMRLLPTLFGVLGVVATWKLARALVGEVAALVSTFLVAVAPWHLDASGTARYFSLVYLLAAVVYLHLPLAYDGDRPRDYLITLLAMVTGTLTHPSFVFPVAGVVIAVTLVDARGRVGWVWPSARGWRMLWLPFLGFLLAYMTVLRLLGRTSALHNSVTRGLTSTLRLVPAMVEWTPLPVFGAALIGILFLMRSRGRGYRRLGVMTLLAMFVTIVALVVAATVSAVYAGYAIGFLPLAFVAVGALAQLVARTVGDGPSDRSVALAAIGLAAFAVAPATLSHLSDGSRFDYRPAFRHIEATAAGVPVLTWPDVLQQEYAPHLIELPLRPEPRYLGTVLDARKDIWIVASVKRYGIAFDDTGAFAAWLADHCRLALSTQKPRLDYRVYRVDLYRCRAGDEAPR